MTRSNSGVRWWHALPALVGLGFGIWGFWNSVPRLVTQLTGVEGTFHAERCRWETDSDGDRQAACTGSFTAADGSFTLRAIPIDGLFERRPTGPVPAQVAGESADHAVRPDLETSLAPIGLGLVCCVFPAWAATAAVRDALARRRHEAAPAEPVEPAGLAGPLGGPTDPTR